jgi:hypothetical protein
MHAFRYTIFYEPPIDVAAHVSSVSNFFPKRKKKVAENMAKFQYALRKI